MYWTRTGSRWSLHRKHCTHCQMGKVRQGLCWDYVVLLMPLKARLLGSPRVATSDWMLESSWEYYKASHQAPFADISWSWRGGGTLSSLTHCGEQHLPYSIYFHNQKTALAILYYGLIKNPLVLYHPFALVTCGAWFQTYCLLQEGVSATGAWL